MIIWNSNKVSLIVMVFKYNSPVLICPGLSESANDYVDLMSNIKNRRCIALSFRGRGKSESPIKGYTLIDHVKDIESVILELGLKDICIMGVSRGVSYALEYAVSNSSLIKGLILGEYPAKHKKMAYGWAKESMGFYSENCESISISYDVLKCIEEDSEQIDFTERLSCINCPSLILKGELEGSLLDRADIVNYIENLSSDSIRIEKFKKAGHDIKSDDFKHLIKVINEFLLSID
ncbi:MAG: alpha/beta fold hydrolase [Paraclostridium sp.]